MKTSTLIKAKLLILLMVIVSSIYSNPIIGFNPKPKHSSHHILDLKGKIIKELSSKPEKYTVTLLYDNTAIESKTVSTGQFFNFEIEFSSNKDNWYAIEIKREGCVTKLISINTALPKENTLNRNTKLIFDVIEPIRYSEAKYFHGDEIDFPSAIISYYKEKDGFYLNEEYYHNIRKRIVESLVRE